MSEFEEFLEIYNIYRDHVKHEDTLLNQRLNFLIASQSFLFIPYFTVLKEFISNDSDLVLLSIILFLICCLGYFIKILTESSIQGFVDASSAINQQWKTEYLKSNSHVQTKGYNTETENNIQIDKDELADSTNLAFLTFSNFSIDNFNKTIPNIRYENNNQDIKNQINIFRNQMPRWLKIIWCILFVVSLIFLLIYKYC